YWVGPLHAGTIGVDPTGGQSGLVSGYGGLTLGWEFQVTETDGITVDGLGFWDDQSDGFVLSQTFPVGLWDSASGTLLCSTTVSSGSALKVSLEPTGGWRVNAVAPVYLAPGLYRVGALMPVGGANQIVSYQATVQSGPGVSLVRYLRQIGSSTLAMPDITMATPDDANFGPTFTFTPGPPSPSSSVVAPQNFTSVPGNGGLNTLLRNNGNPRSYQMQFSSAALGGLPAGAHITELHFRLSTNSTAAFPTTAVNWSAYEVTLAQAVNAIPNMSTTFASNMKSPVLVKSGTLSLAPYTFSAGSLPNDFASFIVLDRSYVYRGGDLVMFFREPGSDSITTPPFLDAVNSVTTGYGTDFRALSATSFTALSGVAASATIVKIIFAYVPAQSIVFEGANVMVVGTGGPPGGTYHLLSSTDLSLPSAQWTAIAVDQFDSAGTFRYTNAMDSQARFFRIVMP
ncbi:MAG: hypothetical protein ACREIC_19550, partial [Limisphaerales bacterium]